MANYAKVKDGVVVGLSQLAGTVSKPDLIALPADHTVELGYLYDGTTFSAPPDPGPTYRKILTALEWVQTFTPAEWRALKNLAGGNNTVAERLDQLLDAIRLTNSVDLESAVMVQFYTYIVNQGWVTQARADELQEGVLE